MHAEEWFRFSRGISSHFRSPLLPQFDASDYLSYSVFTIASSGC
jgi:hypothetical protein